MGKKTYFKLVLYIVLGFFSLNVFPYEDEIVAKPYSPSFTPIRFSFFPDVWAWPEQCNIYGLNIGLVTSNDEKYSSYEYVVAGLDLAWFISVSNNVYGIQMSWLNKSMRSASLQLGGLNIEKKSSGAQFGLINISEDSDLFQLGIYNQGNEKSALLQFGLINVMQNGFLPFFPILNFTVE